MLIKCGRLAENTQEAALRAWMAVDLLTPWCAFIGGLAIVLRAHFFPTILKNARP
jgi:hypothetical protein